MNFYTCMIDLKDDAKALAFARAVEDWMVLLKSRRVIVDWRLLRRKLNLADTPFRDFMLDIAVENMEQLDRAFRVSGSIDEEVSAKYRAVHTLIRRADFGLYRPFPDPERAANIADWITKSAANVTVPQLGVAGFLIALATASLLFGTLERTANQIWGVTRQRSPVAKFTMFYTIATLGPLIIIYSVAQPIVTRVAEQTFVPTPVLTTGLGLTLLNRFVPATHVRWPAALAGGVVSALLFEVGKWGFGHYLAAVTTYEGIYGSLSLMPVFTVWTYVSWMIVLLGVELAFVAQHLEVVRSEGYVNPTLRRDTTRVVSTARIAARVLLAVCDHYDRHSKGLRLADLEDRYQVGLSRLIDITNRLEEAKLLLETADEESCFVPARPLDLLLVRDVVALFDAGDIDNARKDERLSAIFADVDAFQARSIGSLNYQELVEQARAQRERTDERPEI